MSAAENTASLCQAFQDTVARTPDRIALRTLGGTREVTWREYGQQVSGLAATLTDLGVQRGDTVASMMANRIKFHFLDVAIMHLGAVPVSIYNTLRPSEIAYILQNSGARIAFARNSCAMRSRCARERSTGGRSEDTSVRSGFGACTPEAMNAARPPDLSTANDFCATSPPTVSNTASQPLTTFVKSVAL